MERFMIQRTRRQLGGLLLIGLLLVVPSQSVAQTFTSGSTGADGPFNPTSNTTLTLPPNGVFNFTTINIPEGVKVTFTRNAANTPVYLLATGNVTITGTLDVSAGVATSYGRPGPGGPGGFDGGAGADGIINATGGPGLGTGGGAGATGTAGGGGGGHAVAGASGSVCVGSGCSGTGGGGGPAYGSTALRPILGGSGGGGGGGTIGSSTGGGGGGGGGAIVVASSGTISLVFSTNRIVIQANGGTGGSGSGGGGGGSGGAIRVIAPTITGYGQMVAQGAGNPGYPGAGANGRIRVEATTLTYNGSTTPLATSGLPQPVFPAMGQPSLAIASVGGLPAPATPSGSLLAAPDILLPTGASNPVEVLLTATNIPLGTAIQVTATPQSGAKTSATSGGLSGSLASSTATASLTINLSQTSVLTATATFPLVASAGAAPVYAEGEEVTHVRVAALLGGGSTVTYLTRSGREVSVR